jgi:hypothetical protein
MKKLILASALFLGVNASADFTSLPDGGPAQDAVNVANDVFSVTSLRLGKYVFKIVSMDSALNGDINSTTIVLVGENGVGGLAGYHASFQLSPSETRHNLIGTTIKNGKIELTFSSFDGPDVTVRFTYDPKTKTLVE